MTKCNKTQLVTDRLSREGKLGSDFSREAEDFLS